MDHTFQDHTTSTHNRQVQEGWVLNQGAQKGNREYRHTRWSCDTGRNLARSCWHLCITFKDLITQNTVRARPEQPAALVTEMKREIIALFLLLLKEFKEALEQQYTAESPPNAAVPFCSLCYNGMGQYKMKKNIQGQKNVNSNSRDLCFLESYLHARRKRVSVKKIVFITGDNSKTRQIWEALIMIWINSLVKSIKILHSL